MLFKLQAQISRLARALSLNQLTSFNISIGFIFSIFIYGLVEFPEEFVMLQSGGGLGSGGVGLRIRELIV
ncbi:hypothetical protein E2C01_091309 [Portunus trituberculatus]|uniref:Uncharacterized protein n=1 Tax=Portunus trituberculatus TaxID=210409 RepID=A0A5B7JIS0_PORTR|nr:hypothetical protein [Portunus trituberculatus]